MYLGVSNEDKKTQYLKYLRKINLILHFKKPNIFLLVFIINVVESSSLFLGGSDCVLGQEDIHDSNDHTTFIFGVNLYMI